jgi:8-oxo-dGTP diphosphatase
MEAKMSNYVLIFVQRGYNSDNTLFILKDRPEWQKGKLNLPGGKIEEGETPEEAAVRELKEETGYEPAVPVRTLGKMQDGKSTIFCVKAVVTGSGDPHPRIGETEEPLWIPWYKAEVDLRLIPNLRVIIPLMCSGVTDWLIGDTYRGHSKSRHTIKISLPTRAEGSNGKFFKN